MPTKTLYLNVIDEQAMMERLPLERTGTWEGGLPPTTMIDAVRVTQGDNCAVAQAKGSLAGYELLSELVQLDEFEDGVLVGGTHYLPTAAFHYRLYEGVLDKLAEVVSQYDRVIARPFVNRKPQRPITCIGKFGVEIYEGGEWLAPGHIESEFVVWAVNTPQPEEPPLDVKPGRTTEMIGLADVGIDITEILGKPEPDDERVDAIGEDVVD